MRKRTNPLVIACAGALLLSALISWLAVREKSPTYDEPQHATGAWMVLHHRDFRVDADNPPLWHYWTGIANSAGALRIDFQDEQWRQILHHSDARFDWIRRTLWQTPGNDGQRLIARSRAMMLLFAVLLGVLITRWAWLIAGPLAALVATLFYAFDPNFLAHGPLVKNDVAITFAAVAMYLCTWQLGQAVTWGRIAGFVAATAVAMGIKFSAPPLIGVAMGLLIVRAVLPGSWRILNRDVNARGARVGVALAICGAVVVINVLFLWAIYGFRFAPTPDGMPLNMQEMVERRWINQALRDNPYETPTVIFTEPDVVLDFVMFLNHHELLPQAWLWGFLYHYATTILRATYALGMHENTGWWWYFPFAMLVKTPLATLVAMAGAVGVAAIARMHLRVWSALCLGVPPAIYLAMSMSSSLNLGLRHVFPVYPFLFIGIGLAAAALWESNRRIPRAAVVVLPVMLVIETLAVFPNFIPFFNLAAGGARGGFTLLSDSNLDWGQDLKLLARFQEQHPDTPLYLSYFGSVEPSFYGIRYRNLFGSRASGDVTEPRGACFVAVSARNLQGVGFPPERRDYYKPLRTKPPFAVLGGSIYVFDYRDLDSPGR